MAIRHHDVGAAVVEVQFELGDRADLVAVRVAAPTLEPEAPAVPAFGDGHPEHVLARSQHVGDVERLVAQAMPVRRPAGGQHVVADASTRCNCDGVDTERRGVQPGPRQTGADDEAIGGI